MQYRPLHFGLETNVRRAPPTQVIPNVAGEHKMVGVDGVGRERVDIEWTKRVALEAGFEVQMCPVTPAAVATQPSLVARFDELARFNGLFGQVPIEGF